ncbi:hypothetical protein ACFUGD_02040 [Streptomyces sp. NPDC057217]|uniref:helix-turn-helix domain-containing protein n=1 Tax=Streptomyces sp. NPDC057217 TaxID=3346054 RepID=UPI003631C261
MSDQADALTRLVQQHVGEGRALTVRAFAERAVDPVSGTRVSKSTAGNLVQGHQIKITPEVLAAIAEGLGLPLAEVQAAAMRQYVGIVVDDPFATPAGEDDVVVRVAHDPEKSAEDMPTVRAFLDRAAREHG